MAIARESFPWGDPMTKPDDPVWVEGSDWDDPPEPEPEPVDPSVRTATNLHMLWWPHQETTEVNHSHHGHGILSKYRLDNSLIGETVSGPFYAESFGDDRTTVGVHLVATRPLSLNDPLEVHFLIDGYHGTRGDGQIVSAYDWVPYSVNFTPHMDYMCFSDPTNKIVLPGAFIPIEPPADNSRVSSLKRLDMPYDALKSYANNLVSAIKVYCSDEHDTRSYGSCPDHPFDTYGSGLYMNVKFKNPKAIMAQAYITYLHMCCIAYAHFNTDIVRLGRVEKRELQTMLCNNFVVKFITENQSFATANGSERICNLIKSWPAWYSIDEVFAKLLEVNRSSFSAHPLHDMIMWENINA